MTDQPSFTLTAEGARLDLLAEQMYGIRRGTHETDDSLRKRCLVEHDKISPVALPEESTRERRKRKVTAILYRNGALKTGTPRAMLEELVDLIGEEVNTDQRRGGW